MQLHGQLDTLKSSPPLDGAGAPATPVRCGAGAFSPAAGTTPARSVVAALSPDDRPITLGSTVATEAVPTRTTPRADDGALGPFVATRTKSAAPMTKENTGPQRERPPQRAAAIAAKRVLAQRLVPRRKQPEDAESPPAMPTPARVACRV